MAKNTKKISISQIDAVIKDTFVPETVVDWHGLELRVARTLTFDDMFGFVNYVVSGCFDKETGTYHPEMKDALVRGAIVSFYSNVNIPDNADHSYNILMRSGVVEEILSYVDDHQFGQMMKAIDSKIKNIADANISTMNMRFNELMNAICEMQETFSKVFGNVTNDDMQNVLDFFANGGVSSDTLVEAYSKISKKEGAPSLEVVGKEEE